MLFVRRIDSMICREHGLISPYKERALNLRKRKGWRFHDSMILKMVDIYKIHLLGRLATQK